MAAATDSAGNVYIAGETNSADFPVKNGFQPRMGGAAVRASFDSGNTWAAVAIPEPVFSVAGSAKQPWNMYAGTSSSIYKSTDSGKSWNRLDAGPSAQVNALVVDAANPSIVYAGTGSGLFQTKDAGATWSELDPEPGYDEPHWNVIDLVANPARPSMVLAGLSLYPRSDDSGNLIPQVTIYRSTDSGATWTPLPGLPEQVISLAGDPANPDVLYATTNRFAFGNFCDPSSTSIYKTTDSGNTWVKLSSVAAACSTFALAAGPAFIYAATVNGVMRSGDGGATWKATAVTASADTVIVDPNNPQVVYASAGEIAVSIDGGTAWKISLPIRQNVQTIATVPGSPGLVFVGATPGQNAFVTKWSGDGTQMIYSTYLGGSYYDFPTGIAVDGQGNAYVTGYTYSTDFPVTGSSPKSVISARPAEGDARSNGRWPR